MLGREIPPEDFFSQHDPIFYTLYIVYPQKYATFVWRVAKILSYAV